MISRNEMQLFREDLVFFVVKLHTSYVFDSDSSNIRHLEYF